MIGINAKSQTWSLDIILGVLVFVAAFFIFYIILGSSQPSNVKNLKEEASIVIKQVASDDNLLSVINNNEVNESKLHELKNLSYEELKRRLRITSDFCIYFEDDRGYIVIINNSYKGVGSPNINISNTPCSQK